MRNSILIHLIILLIAVRLCASWQVRPEPNLTPQSMTAVQTKRVPNPTMDVLYPTWSEILKPGKVPEPYQIVGFLRGKKDVDLRPLWKILGIAEYNPDYLFRSCDGECDIDQTRIMPLGEIEQQSVLRIGTPGNYRYLVFDERTASTRFLGFIDVLNQYYETPSQRIVTIGGKGTWLVLTTGGRLRTGASAHFDTWYDLNRSGIPIVMSYPSAGDEWNYGSERPCIWFYSKVLSESVIQGRYTVDVLFNAEYSDCLDDQKDDLGKDLFSNARKVSYVWNSRTKRFNLDRANSQLTEKELRSRYAIDDPDLLTNEQLLSYNYAELANLAVSGEHYKRRWLSAFLKACKSSPEKRSLSALISRRGKSKS